MANHGEAFERRSSINNICFDQGRKAVYLSIPRSPKDISASYFSRIFNGSCGTLMDVNSLTWCRTRKALHYPLWDVKPEEYIGEVEQYFGKRNIEIILCFSRENDRYLGLLAIRV